MAVTYTQAQIDELSAALASGILTVHYAGPPARTITYQSLSEMRKQLEIMVASVSAAAGTPRQNYRRVTFKRGFRDDG